MSWWLGGALVAIGSVLGAFGTVAWLTALCATSLSTVLTGVVGLGVLPLAGGAALLWGGLNILEAHAGRQRVRALLDAQFVEAVRGGATAQTVAHFLGVTDVAETTARLDELVARDLLSLEIADDGQLLYRPRSAVT